MNIKHLMTGHKGNSEFCFPETDVLCILMCKKISKLSIVNMASWIFNDPNNSNFFFVFLQSSSYRGSTVIITLTPLTNRVRRPYCKLRTEFFLIESKGKNEDP